MDVFCSSIDIRDLLSSTTLDDPSTPLSAPDLHLLIDRLQVHSVRIKSQVQDYLVSHWSEFSSLFSRCFDVATKTEHISGELVNLLSLLSDRPGVDGTIKCTVEDIVGKSKELREKRELFELLSLILEVCEKLKIVKDDIRNGRVEEAAETLRELKIALRVDDDDKETGLVLYQILRKEWNDCFEEVQDTLVTLVQRAVKFEPNNNSVRVKRCLTLSGDDKIELCTVLKAMDAVGVLNYGLAKVADLMIKHIVSPAIVSGASVAVLDAIGDDQQTAEEVLSVVSSTYGTIDSLDCEKIFSSLILIVEFINKSICCHNGHWMRCFGRLTWPRMSEKIISNFLSKVVPDDASKFTDFQNIIKLSADFEVVLMDLMFISSSDDKDKRLSVFTDNVEVHFASRKRVEILAKARYMLLQSGFTTPQDYSKAKSTLIGKETSESQFNNSVNLLFTAEKCIVSEAALNLMDLVHKVLKEVCLSSPRVGLEFYRAARDSLLLYEAVVPVKLEKQLDSINQAAVLMHNDCLYLSQEILGLAFEYRPDFPNPIKEDAVFIDLAPRFHLMAENILKRQIQLVIVNLEQAIDGADGFQNTHLPKQFESAKFSIDQVAFILEKVHIIWEPLMMPSIYKKSMSMILEDVYSKITKDILNLDDMAAEETLQLQRLIHLLFENLSSTLETLPPINQARNSEVSVPRLIDELIPSYKKLRKLEDLLDMPLKSITEAWESGELICCNFTSGEVKDFIQAIFTDSPLRKECLFRIESCGF